MTLLEYVSAHGARGERRRIQERAEISYETLRRVLRGGRVRDVDVARRISSATQGHVAVWELMQLVRSDVHGLEGKRGKAQRKH